MKKITKITGVILSLLIVLSCISVSFVSAVGEVYSFSYINGEATISRCQTLARGLVEIPETCIKTIYVCNVEDCGYETDFRSESCPVCKEKYTLKAKELTVPVTGVGSGAFAECTYITEIVIPSSIKKIGDGAFRNCTSLEKVTFEGSVCEIGKSVFAYCNVLKEISLPSSLRAIPDEAFNTCTSLESINIPSTVEVIGNEAFKMCEKLQQIDISANVKQIKKNAFVGCKSVKAFNVDDANRIYSDVGGILYGPFYDFTAGYFTNDKALIQYPNTLTASSFTVPSDVKRIDDYAFGDNTNIKSVKLPEGLKTIEAYAFYSCTNLAEINIPSTVTFIGQNAFAKCGLLRKISIPASVQKFEFAFYRSGLEEVTLENGVKTISTRAFENCSNLKSVTIPDSVEKIGLGAFYNCTSLGETEIPSSVKSIGTSAFEGCTSLSIIAEEGSAAYEYAEENGIEISDKNEEVSFFQQIINAIIAFFEMLFSIFM